jgi:hypothetical protein
MLGNATFSQAATKSGRPSGLSTSGLSGAGLQGRADWADPGEHNVTPVATDAGDALATMIIEDESDQSALTSERRDRGRMLREPSASSAHLSVVVLIGLDGSATTMV